MKYWNRSAFVALGAGAAVSVCVWYAGRREPPEIPPEVTQLKSETGSPPPKPDAGAELETLLKTDPTEFLKRCVDHYDKNVVNYSTIMDRHERVEGKLKEPETIECVFREKPFSVLMVWKKNPSGADKALYVEGQRSGKMLVHPTGAIGLIKRSLEIDPEGSLVKASNRYNIKEFGFRLALLRAYDALKAAKDAGALHCEYLGIEALPESENRRCHVLLRDRYAAPEVDGVTKLKLYIDVEHLVLLRSEMHGKDGELIGKYVFRNTRWNLKGLGDEHFSAEKNGL